MTPGEQTVPRPSKVLLAAAIGAATVVLLTRDPSLVFVALATAVAAFRLEPRVPALFAGLSPRLRLGALLLLAGVSMEFTAWLGSYVQRDEQPRLMHPQLGPDLILAFGFYGGLARAWLAVAARYEFTAAAATAAYGLWGILLEQRGALLPAAIRFFPAAPFATLWMVLRVGLVYGSVAALACALAGPPLAARSRLRTWPRWPLAILALTAGAFLGVAAVALVASSFGGLPPPGPIRLRPLW